MNTNNVLTRKMGEFDVYQRTMDGFFDASSLLKQWNTVLPKGAKTKLIYDFLRLDKTEDFIQEITKHEMAKRKESHAGKSLCGDYKVVVNVKGKATKYGRTPDRVWMHPYLFIDFAMWLNPVF